MSQKSSGFREAASYQRDISPHLSDQADQALSPRRLMSSEALTREALAFMMEKQKEQNILGSTYERNSEQFAISQRSYNLTTEKTNEEKFKESEVYLKAQEALKHAKKAFKATNEYKEARKTADDAHINLKEAENVYLKAQEALAGVEEDAYLKAQKALGLKKDDFNASGEYKIPGQAAVDKSYAQSEKSDDVSLETQKMWQQAENAFIEKAQQNADEVHTQSKNLADAYPEIQKALGLKKYNFNASDGKIKEARQAADKAFTNFEKLKDTYAEKEKALQQAENAFTKEARQAANETFTNFEKLENASLKVNEAFDNAQIDFWTTDEYKALDKAANNSQAVFFESEGYLSYNKQIREIQKSRDSSATKAKKRSDVINAQIAYEKNFYQTDKSIQNREKAQDNFYASTYKMLEQAADKATEELNAYLEPPKALQDRGRRSGGGR
jgi:hypothetical protein